MAELAVTGPEHTTDALKGCDVGLQAMYRQMHPCHPFARFQVAAPQEELLAALLKEHWFKFVVGQHLNAKTKQKHSQQRPCPGQFVSCQAGLGLAVVVRLLQRVMSKAATRCLPSHQINSCKLDIQDV